MAQVVTPKPLGQARATIAGATIYTAPAGTTAVVRLITMVNTDSGPYAAAHELSLHKVPSGGAAGDGNAILPPETLVAVKGMLTDDGAHELSPGDFIVARADAENVITVTVEGAEVTG